MGLKYDVELQWHKTYWYYSAWLLIYSSECWPTSIPFALRDVAALFCFFWITVPGYDTMPMLDAYGYAFKLAFKEHHHENLYLLLALLLGITCNNSFCNHYFDLSSYFGEIINSDRFYCNRLVILSVIFILLPWPVFKHCWQANDAVDCLLLLCLWVFWLYANQSAFLETSSLVELWKTTENLTREPTGWVILIVTR